MGRAIKLLLGFTLVFSASANAGDIRWSGFGSVTGGIASDDKGLDEDEHNFRNSEYGKSPEFKDDSKLALQATMDLQKGLSATVQMIARGKTDFDTTFEWAYLSYDLSPTTKLRGGRLRIPFYKYSDYLDVGYAYPFASPPKAMYSLLFSTYDGLNLLNNVFIGDVEISTSIVYGSVSDIFLKTTTPTKGKLEEFKGANLKITYDWLSLYAAYFHTSVDIPLASLTAFPSEVRVDGDTGTFHGGGLSVDYNNFIFNAETSQVDIHDSAINPNEQWYVNAGYRIGSFLPYVTHEETKTKLETYTGALAAYQPVAVTQQLEYTATSLGLRYDFHPSAALKIQYTAFRDIYDSNPASAQGKPNDTESLKQLTFGIDFVF